MSEIMRLALVVLLMLPEARLLTQETARTQDQGQTSQPLSAARRDDPVAMYMRLFDLLDPDRDGVTPLADIFEALDLKRAEARQIKRVRALDANSDGKVTRSEAVAGIRAEIEYQTRRRLNNDADGDGELTSLEYALSVPDPEGKADSSGLTPLQQSSFKADDLDGNGRITRMEIETRVARAHAGSYWALGMAVRARRADIDQDGLIDEREFAPLIGKPIGEQLSGDDRKRIAMTGARDGRLTVQNLQILFIRMNETERIEAEKRMAAFEERFNSQPRPQEKIDQ
jgi:Ca2+-binding EF-hand superfamily protein